MLHGCWGMDTPESNCDASRRLVRITQSTTLIVSNTGTLRSYAE